MAQESIIIRAEGKRSARGATRKWKVKVPAGVGELDG